MPHDMAPTYVSTHGVALALGVSVSTVKRWVDDGVLPARRTAGGHRKLLVADVLELARREVLPHADVSRLTSPRPAGREPATAVLANQLYGALISGDVQQVRALLHGPYRNGMSIEALADHVIEPAMKRIGLDWEAGRIDVMEEHRGSQLCAASLYELKAMLEYRAGRPCARAVGGAVEGDFSVLPSLLAQMVLLDAGWDAINLGSSTPFPTFMKAIVDLRPRLLWVSIAHVGSEEDFVAAYGKLYQLAEKSGVAVAVGGSGLTELVRSRIPYTTYGDRLGHLAAFARTLQPRPRRPRRGRPTKDRS